MFGGQSPIWEYFYPHKLYVYSVHTEIYIYSADTKRLETLCHFVHMYSAHTYHQLLLWGTMERIVL